MYQVVQAQRDDIGAWLRLAEEVEPLFGPLVGEPSFHAALERNIARGTALCVRAERADAPLRGGLLFSPNHAPCYRIGWLAVSAAHRGRGIGQLLVEAMLERVVPPATVEVVTFGADHLGGTPARAFYAVLGFSPVALAPIGPEGGSREVFQLLVQTPPSYGKHS